MEQQRDTIPINRPITSKDDFKQQLKWLAIDVERLVRLNVDLAKGELVHDLRQMVTWASIFVAAALVLLCALVFLAMGIGEWLVMTEWVEPPYQSLVTALACLVEFAIVGGIAAWRLSAIGKAKKGGA